MNMYKKIKDMLISKKGSISALTNKYVQAFIGLIVLFAVVTGMYPTLIIYGNNLSASGIPFGSLFANGGLVFILIAVGLLLAVISLVMPGHKK